MGDNTDKKGVASQGDGVFNGYPPKPEGYTTAIAQVDPTRFVTSPDA